MTMDLIHTWGGLFIACMLMLFGIYLVAAKR